MPNNIDELFAMMAAMAKVCAKTSGKDGMVCGMGFIVASNEEEAELLKRLGSNGGNLSSRSGRIFEGEVVALPNELRKLTTKR